MEKLSVALVAACLACVAVRAEAQRRITVEVYYLQAQPDVVAQYRLADTGQERPILQEKFFKDLGQLAKGKKVKLLDGLKVTALEGEEATAKNQRETFSLRKTEDGNWRLTEDAPEGSTLKVVPRVMEDGKVRVLLEHTAVFPGENSVLEAGRTVEIVASGQGQTRMQGSTSVLLENGKPCVAGITSGERSAVITVATARVETEVSQEGGAARSNEVELQTLTGTLASGRGKENPDTDYLIRLDGGTGIFRLAGECLKGFKTGDHLLVRGVIKTMKVGGREPPDLTTVQQTPAAHWVVYMDVREAKVIASPFGE